MQQTGRREFLELFGAAAIAVATPESRIAGANRKTTSKSLQGIFPIAQTPFTESNQLDLDSLVEEVRFIHRGGVHGFVWPQLASEWASLGDRERMEGAEAIAATGKKLGPAIVIGVQSPDIATSIKYARHAEKVGADAIISLPPDKQSDPTALLDYYKQVGASTELPLFVQAVGSMSVDLILSMYKAIPTFRYVKDEAGEPLMRLAPLREGSNGQLKVFTGGHGKTLIDEMIRGFSGSMPAASFADLYARSWDQWHEGKHKEAVQTFGDAAILVNEISAYPEGMKYILYLRGVFKTYHLRKPPESAGAGSRASLDETSKRILREVLELMKPNLKA
jgi:dihydrodipicolinate synthase/N-acetylneuraminate lyase